VVHNKGDGVSVGTLQGSLEVVFAMGLSPSATLGKIERRASLKGAAVSHEVGPSVEHVLGNAIYLDQHFVVLDIN
jgi:hypothetical protein